MTVCRDVATFLPIMHFVLRCHSWKGDGKIKIQRVHISVTVWHVNNETAVFQLNLITVFDIKHTFERYETASNFKFIG